MGEAYVKGHILRRFSVWQMALISDRLTEPLQEITGLVTTLISLTQSPAFTPTSAHIFWFRGKTQVSWSHTVSERLSPCSPALQLWTKAWKKGKDMDQGLSYFQSHMQIFLSHHCVSTLGLYAEGQEAAFIKTGVRSAFWKWDTGSHICRSSQRSPAPFSSFFLSPAFFPLLQTFKSPTKKRLLFLSFI